jgi:tRNA dimethylallyltransferase
LEWRGEKCGGIKDDISLSPVLLLPPRDWLYTRCDARFVTMMRSGALSEVQDLLKKNLPADAPIVRSIGFPELSALLSQEISENDAIRLGQIATRQYAKRQFTWFRNQSPDHWPRWEEEINDSNLDNIVTLLQLNGLT